MLREKVQRALRGDTPIALGNGVGDFPHAASFDGSDELVLVGEGRRRGSRGDIELGEDVADVPIDCLLAQGKLARNGLVGFAGRDPAKDLEFARCQPISLIGRGALHQRVDPGEIGCGAQPLEYGLGRVDLQIGTVLVPKGAAGQSDQHAHARSGIGRLDPLSHLEGAA
jgi:hypothetical protein